MINYLCFETGKQSIHSHPDAEGRFEVHRSSEISISGYLCERITLRLDAFLILKTSNTRNTDVVQIKVGGAIPLAIT